VHLSQFFKILSVVDRCFKLRHFYTKDAKFIENNKNVAKTRKSYKRVLWEKRL